MKTLQQRNYEPKTTKFSILIIGHAVVRVAMLKPNETARRQGEKSADVL